MYMPFIYKVICTLRTNNRLVIDRSHLHRVLFLRSYHIGDRLCCLVDGQPDDVKEQISDLDVFGHYHHKKKKEKKTCA
jgi:hypothetical protein